MCKCVVFQFISTARPAATTPPPPLGWGYLTQHRFISTARPAATTPPPPLGWGYLTQHRDTQFKTILPIFDILT